MYGGIGAANQQKQIDDEDRDQDQAADEDMGLEAENGLVLGKIRRRDVVWFVVALVFVHADKLICKCEPVRRAQEMLSRRFRLRPLLLQERRQE